MSPEKPQQELQTATFDFVKFIVRKAVFEQVPRIEPSKDDKRPPQFSGSLTFNVSRRIQPDPPRGMVTLGLVIQPDFKWQPYKLEVTVAALFSSKTASVELFDLFCKTNVPVILFPYVRQIVHTLTADAEYGPVRLSPVNLSAVLANMQEERFDDETAETSGPTEPEQPS